ncbi:MAG: 50S ribosomal protein L11 [Candidatus Nanohalarchaeota archaeon]|nr:MAG: 50S ribosomal protein L11 [Candidatus Nanohaloarchaeota archaeon]
MAKTTIESIVDGGKASAGPPLGPALGPMSVNIKSVIDAINEKTKDFAGMKVPTKVIIDTGTKEFKIEIGSPAVSQLIKKEAKLKKLAGKAGEEHVADLKIEQIIKIAKMKEDTLPAKTRKDAVKTVIGTCLSCGVLVEEKDPRQAIKEVNEGKYEEKIKSGKTELTEEELKQLEQEKIRLKQELEERRQEYETKTKQIIGEMKGKDRKDIETKLKEAEIPEEIIKTILPDEEESKEDKKDEGASK